MGSPLDGDRLRAGGRKVFIITVPKISDSISVSQERVQQYMQSLAYTLCSRRSVLDWTSSAVIDSVDSLKALPNLASTPVRRVSHPKLGFAFTGQGAQYAGMGIELLRFTAFRKSLEKSEQCLAKLGCIWSLTDELAKPAITSNVNRSALSQPLSTIVQIGIVDLMYALDVKLSAVVGHSSGEIAAAYAIGGLTHESACKVAYYRGLCAEELLQQQTSPCGMLAAGLAEQDFGHYESQLHDHFGIADVVVACINSSQSITLSGRADQIEWLEAVLQQKSVFARRLRVEMAYHSPRMQATASHYLKLMGSLNSGDPSLHKISMVSSVTGQRISHLHLSKAQYWVDNMVQPVKFSLALANTLSPSKLTFKSSKVSIDEFVEIGPHGALQGPMQDVFRTHGTQAIGYLPSLIRSVAADVAILRLVGTLWCKGCALDLMKINNDGDETSTTPMVLPSLPKYPFNHSHQYWHEARASKEGYRIRRNGRSDLLGTPATDWNPEEARWKNFLRVSEQP